MLYFIFHADSSFSKPYTVSFPKGNALLCISFCDNLLATVGVMSIFSSLMTASRLLSIGDLLALFH